MHGLIVDNFAGGGGASTGIEQAIGRAVDIAINHDEEAIRMHEVNHPGTRHIRNNIWQVDPLEVTGGKPVQLAWFSPDCKHFSKAKGGKPREKSIRDLAWVVVLWGKRAKPDVILLENVEEFQTWGPLDDEGFPIKARAGETFAKWCKELRKIGYRLQFRELRACEYGAPTIRKRFFMIARRDGKPIVWPEPTHGKPGTPEVLSGKRLPWRTAAEIIDWSIPCPSIFERKKELADKTKRRIAHGIVKFVLNNPRPFIVPLIHHGSAGRSYGLDDPVVTVTAANRGELAMVAPYFARTAHGDVDKNGKRRGLSCHGAEDAFPTVTQSQDSALVAATLVKNNFGENPAQDVADPLHTVTTQGNKFGVLAAHITKFRSGAIGHEADEPLHTVTANSFIKRPGGSAPLGVVAATLATLGHGEKEGGKPRTADLEEPVSTIMAGGGKHAAVTAFMQKFASGNAPTGADDPLQTIEGNAKHSVVCAHIEQANGSPDGEKPLPGRAADDPLSTIVAKGCTQRVVTSNLIKLRGTSDQQVRGSAASVEEPLNTISAGGIHTAEVRAVLMKYYGNEEDGHGLTNPIGTVTTKDRFGLVTVTIEGEEYVIVDIGMRMLTPRELFNAQGFPPDYIIDRDAEGRPITKTQQVAKCGNSVSPPPARALVAAQFPDLAVAAEPATEAA